MPISCGTEFLWCPWNGTWMLWENRYSAYKMHVLHIWTAFLLHFMLGQSVNGFFRTVVQAWKYINGCFEIQIYTSGFIKIEHACFHRFQINVGYVVLKHLSQSVASIFNYSFNFTILQLVSLWVIAADDANKGGQIQMHRLQGSNRVWPLWRLL